MNRLRVLAQTRPILFGWYCYAAAWAAMFVVVATPGLIYAFNVIALALGYGMLRVRRNIVRRLPGILIESTLAPLVRFFAFLFLWPVIMPLSLILSGLRRAEL